MLQAYISFLFTYTESERVRVKLLRYTESERVRVKLLRYTESERVRVRVMVMMVVVRVKLPSWPGHRMRGGTPWRTRRLPPDTAP